MTAVTAATYSASAVLKQTVGVTFVVLAESTEVRAMLGRLGTRKTGNAARMSLIIFSTRAAMFSSRCCGG